MEAGDQVKPKFCQSPQRVRDVLHIMGRDEESLAEENRAIELDLLDYIFAVILLYTYGICGVTMNAIEPAKRH